MFKKVIYAELVAEGWISTRAAGGSFVSAALPEPKTRRFAKPAAPAIHFT